MKNKLISIISLAAVCAFGQSNNSKPIRIDCGDGNNSAITIYSTNHSVALVNAHNGAATAFRVNYDGSMVTGATNNVITFAATNTAPVNTSNVVAWISVTVAGNTNFYRLPLYK